MAVEPIKLPPFGTVINHGDNHMHFWKAVRRGKKTQVICTRLFCRYREIPHGG